MAELKLSQMKKTSPSVEPRSPEVVADEKYDMSKSFSSSFVANKKSTEFNDTGDGNTVYLDRHNVTCENGAITDFKLVVDEKNNKMRAR